MWLSSARFPRLRGQSFFQYNLRLWNCVWDNLCTLLCLYFAANQYHTLTQVSLENILILGKQKLSFGSTRWTRIWGAKWRDARAKSLKFSCCCGYSQKIRPRRLQEKKGRAEKGRGGMWKIEEKPSGISKKMTTAWACHGKRDVSVCLAFGKVSYCMHVVQKKRENGENWVVARNSVAYLCVHRPTDRLKAFVIKKSKIFTPTKHLAVYSGHTISWTPSGQYFYQNLII